MQTDGRLVENVKHIDQLRSNLGCQSYALAFSAGERGRLTVKRQVVQANLQQEVQTCTYLLQYLCCNLALLVVQMLWTVVQPLAQVCQVHIGKL